VSATVSSGAAWHDRAVGRLRSVRAAAPIAAVFAVAAAGIAVGSSRVADWVVMTDELLYAKLAQGVADSWLPIPQIHGQRSGFLGIVYPILIAPFYGSMSTPDAFDAVHVWNAVLLASACIPAYLLARRLVPRAWALVVAALSVALPWIVLASFVMSESAAYPIFLWAFLACERALSRPSRRADLLALGGLALAFFTRPQFLVLAVVFPLAALVHDRRRALALHPVAAIAYAVGAVAFVVLAATGHASSILGDYRVAATHGSVLPSGVWKGAVVRADTVALGLGVLPFVLGVGWIALRALKSAFAALALLTIVALCIEVASYDIRFAVLGLVRDRYLFYLAPLILIAAAAAIADVARGRVAIAVAAATVFFAATAPLLAVRRRDGLFVDAVVDTLSGPIRDVASGFDPGLFVGLCGLAIGAAAVTAIISFPRTIVAVVSALAVFAFTGSAAGYAFATLVSGNGPSGRPITGSPGLVRAWVDNPTHGQPTAIFPYPLGLDWAPSAILWWDVEFWNRSVTRTFSNDPAFTYTPYDQFPTHPIRIDPRTGVLAGTERAPRYVVLADGDSRLRLIGTSVGVSYGLSIFDVPRPYRARVATYGLDDDGWTRPGRPARVRVFAVPGAAAERVDLKIHLGAPPTGPASFSLGGMRRTIAMGKQAVAKASVCVPAGGHADVTLRGSGTTRIIAVPYGPGDFSTRTVGPRIGLIETGGGSPC
jgi:hypothetical protein